MKVDCVTGDALSKAFHAVMLLTQSTERTEAAMLVAIQRINLSKEPNAELLRLSVKAALEADEFQPVPAPCEVEAISALLPVELRRVLHLPTNLRQCFVVRMLARLPKAYCASLLRLKISELDELTCLAMETLSGIVEGPPLIAFFPEIPRMSAEW